MKKKIIFVAPSLVGGGAEKVLVDLIGAMDNDKYELFLILFEKKGAHLQSIPHHIETFELGKKSRYSLFKLIIRLALCLRRIKPSTVISFMGYANLITIFAKALSGERSNFVITVHTHLSESLLHLRFRNIWKYLIKKLYNVPNHIVAPSIGVMKDLVSEFKCRQDRICIVSHPIDTKRIETLRGANIDENISKNYILAVGRLTQAKGYLHLIRAYHLISKMIPNNLVILGVGEEEEQLRLLAKELGIEDRVKFLGFQENPYKFMKNASLFVLSSLWESFALVIVEAMACGVPVISSDCPSGPGEIITSGENGVLVPPANEKALAGAMLELLEDEDLRRKFSIAGKKRAEDFRVEKILPQYEVLLK